MVDWTRRAVVGIVRELVVFYVYSIIPNELYSLIDYILYQKLDSYTMPKYFWAQFLLYLNVSIKNP